MKRARILAGVAGAALAATCAAFVYGQPTATAPRATLRTTTISPAPNCCLWRIHKKAVGQRRLQLGTAYKCDMGKTAQGATGIRLILSSEGRPCDENPPLVPDRSVLEARGTTIRRADGFAHFGGSFTIKDPAGTVLFNGRMELIDRIGTHHPPFGSERCDQQGQLEGWLTARGSGPLASFRLHALILARQGAATTAAPGRLTASIDGALVKCP